MSNINLQISLQTARCFSLAHQHLYPPRQFRGKAGVLEFIRHTGSIQFDPINVVGRNPDLVLQSRVRDFRPEMLDELLYEDRQLLDGWDKMAAIYCVEDWPYFARQRARMQARFGVPSDIVMQVAPHILQKIELRGPLSSLDFKDDKKTEWAWGPTKVSRAGLEGLFSMGQLGVHHRVNNRRYFERIEKLLPATLLATPDPNADEATYQEWHILRRMGSLGLALLNAGEHWLGMINMKSQQRRAVINRLVQRGEIITATVTEIPDKTFYLRAQDFPTLERVQSETPEPEAAFLAPLDNFLWNRKKNTWLFDFEYIWEVYKPKKQRQYGYYVLPVIYGDKFIARCDFTFDKKSGQFTLQNWWWEHNVQPDAHMQTALLAALDDFITYLGAQSFELGEAIINDATLQWAKGF